MPGLTARQLEMRRSRVPASAVAGFLGWSPYGPPLQAWEEHLGVRPLAADPDLLETGNEMEDGIARGAARTLRWGRMERSGTMVHPEDWACATPDRLFPDRQTGMQIKNHHPAMMRKFPSRPTGGWDNNAVPKHHLIQCLWEMAVVRGALGWRVERWVLCAYFGGATRRLYHLRWDPILMPKLWAAAHRFWQRHIDPAGPREPPVEAAWHARPRRETPRPPKLSNEELLAAPLPDIFNHGAKT